VRWSVSVLLFAALVLLVVRPLTVLAVVSRRDTGMPERRLLAWFGVRGIGSVYYLAFALNHGVPAVAGPWLLEAVVVTISLSIVLHGVSATPLMARYQRARQRTAG
jgi:sodium/hydrogen antiporter